MASKGKKYPKEMLLDMYKTMLSIRAFETKAAECFTKGMLAGNIHLCIGQEAVPTGACYALEPEDYMTSTHRGHGHCIAKGASLDKMLAELFGKKTGYCQGKGGSMHIADVAGLHSLGANGIVGAGPILMSSIIFVCYLCFSVLYRVPIQISVIIIRKLIYFSNQNSNLPLLK